VNAAVGFCTNGRRSTAAMGLQGLSPIGEPRYATDAHAETRATQVPRRFQHVATRVRFGLLHDDSQKGLREADSLLRSTAECHYGHAVHTSKWAPQLTRHHSSVQHVHEHVCMRLSLSFPPTLLARPV